MSTDHRRLRDPTAPDASTQTTGRGKDIDVERVVHSTQRPASFENARVNVAIVDEGLGLHARISECENHEIRIGIPAEVVFEKKNGDARMRRFRPRR
jgi:hypothetical protein